MIKANELRLGNYVSKRDVDDWKDVKITLIDRFGISHLDKIGYEYPTTINRIKPIPLTEQWLLRFGFQSKGYICPETGYKTNYPYRKMFDENIVIEIEDDFSCSIFNDYEKHYEDQVIFISDRVNKVHKLQNFIFFNTGEELTLK